MNHAGPSAVGRRPAARGGEESSRAKILLVDDDERNLMAMAEVLSPIAEIVTVTSGRDALRVLLKEEFAVILLDVFMPDMDGYETAGLIRAREQTARIPIVFLSAVNKETEHLMRGYAMGAVDYVFKPVDPIVLKSKAAVFVDLFLMRRRIEEQARAEQALHEAKLLAESERLAIERELQQTQLRQAAILGALPIALFEADQDRQGQLTRRFVGGDMVKLVGPCATELAAGRLRWDDAIPAEDAAELARLYGLVGNPAVSANYRWACPGGETIHVMEQAVRIAPGKWIGTLMDVSEQRNLEEQLVQARKMDALGQLTGGVAHDFNNVLAAVLGGLELFERQQQLDERGKLIVGHMRHAADQGVSLVRRLMTFARKQPLSPVAIDPQVLVEAVAGLVGHTFGREHKIAWHVAQPDLRAYADQSQLELALMNLLINARDAMPQGGCIEVVIDRPEDGVEGAGEDGGDFVRIVVQDCGEGIPPALLEKVAEPFFTTKPPGKGTGLGLSMVSGFVQQSGGRVGISSTLGEGTRVELVLPAALKSAERRGSEGAEVQERPGVRRVLLVDDDANVRLVLAEQLRDMGIEVCAAADAGEAIRVLEEDPAGFDFVLSDFAMPGLNGSELIERIRSQWPGMPAALMTGEIARLAHRPNVGPAACDVFQKPLSIRDLESLFAAREASPANAQTAR